MMMTDKEKSILNSIRAELKNYIIGVYSDIDLSVQDAKVLLKAIGKKRG